MARDGQNRRLGKSRSRCASGVTLIETMVAVAILLIVIAGVVPVFIVGFQITEQEGDTATRTVEYAQDKIEQLLTLNNVNVNSDGFNDGTTDTTVFPANPNGCTGTGSNICGLGGTMLANSTVGAVPPAAPVVKFVDYLDTNGNLLTSSTGADYQRQWSVATDATATLKTITVVVTSLRTAAVRGAAPSATLVSVKSGNL
jgi:type II secretory pathway pseudopilin PulG